MKEIQAISGVVTNENDELLLVQRTRRTYSSFLWDLIGGDVDVKRGELPSQTLRRDIKGKLGVNLSLRYNLGLIESIEESGSLILRNVFACELEGPGKITLDQTKYCQFRWVSVDEIKNFDLTPGAINVLKQMDCLV